jgi:hypothetical protein
MRRLLVLAVCSLLAPGAVADAPDPEPTPVPDAAIRALDHDFRNEAKIGREIVQARRTRLLERLKQMHARLVKAGKTDRARALQDRILLAESIKSGQGLESPLVVPKLLDRASSKGRYRELMHVLYMPAEKASYTEFNDYGFWNGNNYGAYNGLKNGYWVYAYPRWYIWKELKP